MKNLLVLLALFIISCGNAPTASAPETGGTSIEVAMIKGIVVDEQNRPVKGATVEIFRQSAIADTSFTSSPYSIKTDSQGKFSKIVTSRGVLSVIIKDTSGNGAFKPCTLTTNDTIIDMGTVKLERLGSLEITLDLSTLDSVSDGINSWKHDESSFFVWSKQFGNHFYFDSTMVWSESGNKDKKDSTYIITISIPAGQYDFRLNPMWLFSMYSKFEIVDTTIELVAGESKKIVFTPRLIATNTIPEHLQHELTIVKQILALNGIENAEKIPHGVGIIGNHVGQLIFSDKIDTIPDMITELKHLEWLRFWGSQDFQSLPKCIGTLRNLQMLELRGCHSLSDLPMELEKLTSLKTVWIESNSFKTLPEVIYKLSSVDNFDIDFHWLPSEREKEWALKRMFHGDQVKYSKWLRELTEKYSTK